MVLIFARLRGLTPQPVLDVLEWVAPSKDHQMERHNPLLDTLAR